MLRFFKLNLHQKMFLKFLGDKILSLNLPSNYSNVNTTDKPTKFFILYLRLLFLFFFFSRALIIYNLVLENL